VQQEYAGDVAGPVLDEDLTAGLKESNKAAWYDAVHDVASGRGGVAMRRVIAITALWVRG
jgi:hypothetical protein